MSSKKDDKQTKFDALLKGIQATENPQISVEHVHRLLNNDGLTQREEKETIDWITESQPDLFPAVCGALLNNRREFQVTLAAVKVKEAKADQLLQQLNTPPLHPATVVRVQEDLRMEVISDSRRLLVAAFPDFDVSEISPGDEIFLDSNSGLAISRRDFQEHAGIVGVVSEVTATGIILRGQADEEIVAIARPELAAELEAGDRVLYNRDFPYILERLPKRKQNQFLLEDVPSTSFEDIGGMGNLIDEVRTLLDLHMHHQDLVSKYGLELLRGITLIGPPGVGKTLFAKAIARHLADGASDADAENEDHEFAKASFIHVKPGSLRGSFYGQTEARMRDLFAEARAAEGLVVLFFDELDSYGSRGEGIGQDIDGRVLGTLLSEIDGLESITNILCIGATNRLDLCDAALIRQGRFGDRVFSVPRPGRAATREILSRYLAPGLGFGDNHVEADAHNHAENAASADTLIDTATGYLHSQREGAGVVATVTVRSGDTHEVRARDILSGAMLASAVQDAKHAAAHREVEALQGGIDVGSAVSHGITCEDLLEALDNAITAEAKKIESPRVARRVLAVPHADEIVRVDIASERKSPRHRYLRVA